MEEHFTELVGAFVAVLLLIAQQLRASSKTKEAEAKRKEAEAEMVKSYEATIRQLTAGGQQQLDDAASPELAARHRRQRLETFQKFEERLKQVEEETGKNTDAIIGMQNYQKGFTNGRSSQGY